MLKSLSMSFMKADESAAKQLPAADVASNGNSDHHEGMLKDKDGGQLLMQQNPLSPSKESAQNLLNAQGESALRNEENLNTLVSSTSLPHEGQEEEKKASGRIVDYDKTSSSSSLEEASIFAFDTEESRRGSVAGLASKNHEGRSHDQR